MKSILTTIALATLLAAGAASAADPVRGSIQPAAASAAAAKGGAVSQQDKMRLCNQQATGKKGAERRAFMKTCLSKKKPAA
jgi:opacity protein-like surface antigen